ncbi:UDP-phosphate N-acetylglucosaminyl 1-phosphate transferase [Rhodobacteraceae bacterium 63075]|nr:UDP-phosphate N-acetylglucosaminyl 1-phosphate transferase [Rhodobacteraceae bacterium 63075]
MSKNVAFFRIDELALLALSSAICLAILLLKSRVPRLSGRSYDISAVQATHVKLTPRVGGLAIFGGLALSLLFAPEAVSERYSKFVAATLILFLVGLLEDLGYSISARNRLLAAVVASAVVVGVLDVSLPRAHIPGLDDLLQYWFVGVLVTIVLTAGIANAFNMIDGVNGLSALTALVAALSLSMISAFAEYTVMVHLTSMLAASVFGFLLLNYPFGWIFLGDAGAYTLGFVLSWFGIAILNNAPDVSPWAILLTMFWPIADMCLAVYRRYRRKLGAMAPDRLHVHQMVMRALEICVLGRGRRHIANPLTTLVLAPFVILPPLTGVLFWDQSSLAFLAVVVFSILFVLSYLTAPKFIRLFRKKVSA